MPDPTRTDIRLRSLATYFLLHDTAERRQKVSALAGQVGFTAAAADKDFIHASVLPQSPNVPYFMRMHAFAARAEKPTDPTAKPAMFVHIELPPKPDGTPPQGLVRLHADGRTLEWLLGAIADLVGKEDTSYLCSAVLEADEGVDFRASVAAPPLQIGGSLLQFAGAEFRSGGEKWELGLSVLRWRRQAKAPTRIWLEYAFEAASFTSDLPRAETARCQEYLRGLL